MKRKDAILFFGAICMLVFVWIGFSIYHTSVTSTIEEPLTVQIIPIQPVFDTKTIGQLKQREKVSPLLEGNQIATPSGKPTPTPTKATLPTPTPIATSSGSLINSGSSKK